MPRQLGSGVGYHLGVRAIGESLKRNQLTLGHQKSPPPQDLTLSKYDIPMYRGIHIAPHVRIEAIGFDGSSWNNERSVTFGGWTGVRILGVLKKYCKVNTKVLRQKCWVGPPIYIYIREKNVDIYKYAKLLLGSIPWNLIFIPMIFLVES